MAITESKLNISVEVEGHHFQKARRGAAENA